MSTRKNTEVKGGTHADNHGTLESHQIYGGSLAKTTHDKSRHGNTDVRISVNVRGDNASESRNCDDPTPNRSNYPLPPLVNDDAFARRAADAYEPRIRELEEKVKQKDDYCATLEKTLEDFRQFAQQERETMQRRHEEELAQERARYDKLKRLEGPLSGRTKENIRKHEEMSSSLAKGLTSANLELETIKSQLRCATEQNRVLTKELYSTKQRLEDLERKCKFLEDHENTQPDMRSRLSQELHSLEERRKECVKVAKDKQDEIEEKDRFIKALQQRLKAERDPERGRMRRDEIQDEENGKAVLQRELDEATTEIEQIDKRIEGIKLELGEVGDVVSPDTIPGRSVPTIRRESFPSYSSSPPGLAISESGIASICEESEVLSPLDRSDSRDASILEKASHLEILDDELRNPWDCDIT